MSVPDLDRLFRDYSYDSPGNALVCVDGSDGSPDLRNDTANLPTPGRSIAVVTAGPVKVTYGDGTTGTIPSALFTALGNQISVRIKRVWSTGTTAIGIWIFT